MSKRFCSCRSFHFEAFQGNGKFTINEDNSLRGPVNKIRGLTLLNSFVNLENSDLLRKNFFQKKRIHTGRVRESVALRASFHMQELIHPGPRDILKAMKIFQ